jgi:hypothetical protein
MAASGVNPALYQAYRFEDHIWSQAQTRRDDLLELAGRCVKVGESYWMKLPNATVWAEFRSTVDAERQALNTWLHTMLCDGKTKVSADLINAFFSGVESREIAVGKKTVVVKDRVGSCPNLQGRMVIPYGPRFVRYKGRTYLNGAEDCVLAGDPARVELGRAILLMIYRSLCNGPALHPDPAVESALLLEQVISDSYSQMEFRFVMNWLAANVQRPGINLQTNLWFVGAQEGIGKGTLVDVMRGILGGLVGSLNQAEIEAGWNDHVLGKSLVEVNEFDTGSKMSAAGWEKWLKAHTCEPELLIRQRNTTAYTVINITNYLFTTNDETPTRMSAADRRNMVVKTTDNPFWKSYASEIKRNLILPRLQAVAKGFAAILEQVDLDLALIMTAPVTAAKAAIQAAHQPQVEEWLTTDELLPRQDLIPASELYGRYKDWLESACPGHRPLTQAQWGREMSRLAAAGRLIRHRSNGTRYEIPPAATPSAAKDQRVEAAKSIAAILNEPLDTHEFDIPIEDDRVPELTPLQRLATRLRRDAACGD